MYFQIDYIFSNLVQQFHESISKSISYKFRYHSGLCNWIGYSLTEIKTKRNSNFMITFALYKLQK